MLGSAADSRARISRVRRPRGVARAFEKVVDVYVAVQHKLLAEDPEREESPMFDPKTFAFDPEKISEFFKQNDFTKQFANFKLPGVDAEAIATAQKKNMEALVEANKAAAAGYQDLFKKQVAIFEETMTEAQKHLKSFDTTKLDAETAKAQAELAKAAFEKALANMQALAESAQKANSNAYEIVAARIQESLAELRDLATQLTKKA